MISPTTLEALNLIISDSSLLCETIGMSVSVKLG
jgi:hypothetical protein